MDRPYNLAFSLLELLISLAIVAILATITVPSFSGLVAKSRCEDMPSLICFGALECTFALNMLLRGDCITQRDLPRLYRSVPDNGTGVLRSLKSWRPIADASGSAGFPGE